MPNPAEVGTHWEQLLSRENLAKALRRVEQNAGAPGIDGMNTKDLRQWLHTNWQRVKQQLDAGTYGPQPVRRVTIDKPSGGKRNLGVPTALDRLIQQALTQVLTPVFDPHFSDHSFGFRPNRSAHQAVKRARSLIDAGAVWAVDVDLDSFFDRVGHDALTARVARMVDDKKVLRLIHMDEAQLAGYEKTSQAFCVATVGLYTIGGAARDEARSGDTNVNTAFAAARARPKPVGPAS